MKEIKTASEAAIIRVFFLKDQLRKKELVSEA